VYARLTVIAQAVRSATQALISKPTNAKPKRLTTKAAPSSVAAISAKVGAANLATA
jgi:hypothetical protein